MNRNKRVLLFDLGGVLADLGTPASDMDLDMSEEAFWDVWLNSASVRTWEMGRLDTPDFCRRIAAELSQDPDTIEARLRNWRLAFFPGVEALVHSIPETTSLALLSNTNEIHWCQVASSGDVFDRFEHLFLSFETGNYKPARAAFEQVTARFDCDPGDVLFLDDSAQNVAAAIDVGLDAHQVRGTAESRIVIERTILGPLT